jgi:cation transport ATPase
MNHQPFESWILDEEPLGKQQQAELEGHLLSCQSCKTLQESWGIAKHQIKSAPVKQPAPGFSMRWQSSLKARREAEERAQSRTLFIWIGCTIAVLLISLAVIAMPKFSIITVMITLVTTLVNVSTSLDDLLQLVLSVTRSVPPTTLILVAISLSSLLSIVSFIWGISIWRISRKGVRQNEED